MNQSIPQIVTAFYFAFLLIGCEPPQQKANITEKQKQLDRLHGKEIAKSDAEIDKRTEAMNRQFGAMWKRRAETKGEIQRIETEISEIEDEIENLQMQKKAEGTLPPGKDGFVRIVEVPKVVTAEYDRKIALLEEKITAKRNEISKLYDQMYKNPGRRAASDLEK